MPLTAMASISLLRPLSREYVNPAMMVRKVIRDDAMKDNITWSSVNMLASTVS